MAKKSPGLIGGGIRFAEDLPNLPFKFAADIGDIADTALGTTGNPRMKRKRRTNRKPPSPAQLAARAKFTAMVKARAAARKKGAKKNGVALADFRRPRRNTKQVIKAKHADVFVHNRARRSKNGTLLSSLRRPGTRNPGRRHLPGLPAKFQRMYEDIKSSPYTKKRYPGREKEVAARTVWKAYESGMNPSEFYRMNPHFSKRQRRAHRIERARRQQKVYRRQHGAPKRGGFRWNGTLLSSVRRPGRSNPPVDSIYSEFRGKGPTKVVNAKAAAGTPSRVAQLGELRELHLRGRKLGFKNPAKLVSDSKKRLHITGVRMKVKGRHNPGEEIDCGEILKVTYRADKPHIEDGTLDYVHRFGEEGGHRPHLIVDGEGYPKIEGGSYRISSDGIID